jgi:hypothetical protein
VATSSSSSSFRPLPAAGSGLPRLEEVAVLALAASRLTRAVSLDEITRPVRERIGERAGRGGTALTWFNKLITCPLCIGWWISIGVSLVAPGRHRVLRGVSVAGAQTFLALAERLVSEEGRAAIHQADVIEARAEQLAS